MEFFIDTADIDAIKKAASMGLVDGVTTNPTLIKKSGRDHEATIREIASIVDGPISVETLSEDGQDEEKDEIKKVHPISCFEILFKKWAVFVGKSKEI